MHGRQRLRKFALAFAVPVVGIAGIALTTHSAASAPTAGTKAAATETPQTGGPATGQQSGSGTPTASGSRSTSTTRPTTPTRTTRGPSTSGPSGVVPGSPGGATCANRSAQPTPITLKIASVSGKDALVDNDGCAVYINIQDTLQSSACDASCVATWPPVKGPAQAGNGVASDRLATFNRTDGTVQATYYTHKLYYNTGDTAPGQATGQGKDQMWYLVDASGNAIQN